MKKSDFNYDMEKHEKFFYSMLSERGKCQYAALEAMKSGYYGVMEISKKFDTHIHTVRKGKKELLLQIVPPANKVHQRGEAEKNGINRQSA